VKENKFLEVMLSKDTKGFWIVLGVFLIYIFLHNLSGQRKLPTRKNTPPTVVQEVVDEPISTPHINNDINVQEFIYDDTAYILVEKNGALAVTRK
tara:strand:- start:297 stop:581 length:285 start_codon:yes stop_codon:yes gene_type:complete